MLMTLTFCSRMAMSHLQYVYFHAEKGFRAKRAYHTFYLGLPAYAESWMPQQLEVVQDRVPRSRCACGDLGTLGSGHVRDLEPDSRLGKSVVRSASKLATADGTVAVAASPINNMRRHPNKQHARSEVYCTHATGAAFSRFSKGFRLGVLQQRPA